MTSFKVHRIRAFHVGLAQLVARLSLGETCSQGFHGDNCATVGVGEIDPVGQRLIDATRVSAGDRFRKLSYSVVYDAC